MAFLDTWLASFLTSGSISYLYYANRIFQLPLAIFAISLTVAIFPTIAKLIKSGDEKRANFQLKRGFWILIFLLSLSATGGIIFAKEIIWLLFERGAFDRSDTLSTASVLQIYMVGLLPFGLSKLFSLWLYSQQRQLEVAKIATWSLVGYGTTAYFLFDTFGIVGLATATTVSGTVNLIFLIKSFGFQKFLELFDRKILLIYTITIFYATALFYWIDGLIANYLKLI
jgi:putative peptidoglycan lipid II flippase